MENSSLSILVVGAGAVGGITAALLKKSGADVEIICKYEDYAVLISEKGLELSGVCGEHTVKMPAYASAEGVTGQKDLVLLATKATDMREAAEAVEPLLKKNGYLVSLQNGICEDELAGIVGKERVIGCVTGWGATMERQGKLQMTSTGDFIIGYPERPADDFLNSVAEAMSAVVPARTTGNIMGHLYSKLIINSCITSLGAICGLYLGKMLSDIRIRRIFIEIVREAIEIGDRMGVKIEIFGGRLDLRTFSGKGLLPALKTHLLLIIIGFKYRKLKSSSLQSLERGKPSEIDHLNGYFVKNALELHIPAPLNMKIVEMIHEIEQKKRDISPANFDEAFFNRFN